MTEYSVIVSNIGTQHKSTNKKESISAYAKLVKYSKSGYGSYNGETVTLLKDGTIIREYVGEIERLEQPCAT